MPEPRPDPALQRRQRSRELTHEIAEVLREINSILAVPLDDRGNEWNARASSVRQRKAALIAEIEALAAEHSPQRTPATRTTGPEVEP